MIRDPLKSYNNRNEIKYNKNKYQEKNIIGTESFVPEITYGDKSGLKPKSDAYKSLYHEYHNALVSAYRIIDRHLQPSVDYLKKTELTGMDFSFETVRNENNLIKKQIKDNNVKLTTDTKKFFYQTDNFINLKSINFCLFILFYSIFVIFIYYVFINITIPFNLKIFYVLIIFLFPFYIKPLEEISWFVIVFLYSLIFGKAYTGFI